MRFRIDWASLIVGSKFTVFALFYFVFGAIFQVQAPVGRIFEGAILLRVFCVTGLGGLYLEGYLLNTILSLLGHLFVFIYTGTNVVLRYFHEKSYFIF